MKKRIIALTSGVCLLVGLTSGCPCYSGYSTDSAKTGNNRVVNAQPTIEQVVVAAANAVGI
jgi:hypothetical protein